MKSLPIQLSNANLFVSAINPKLIKDFDNDSLRKVKSDKADAVKIARYALDKWQNLKQYSVMDELRNQLKTMNRQFGFYLKHKTAMKNNLISILDQTYPGVNAYFDSPARSDGSQKWVDFASSYIKFSMFINLALTFYLQAKNILGIIKPYFIWLPRFHNFLTTIDKPPKIRRFAPLIMKVIRSTPDWHKLLDWRRFI